MKNTLCTPHLGYVTRGTYEKYFGLAFDQINAFFEGKPINLVNPEILKQNQYENIFNLTDRGSPWILNLMKNKN